MTPIFRACVASSCLLSFSRSVSDRRIREATTKGLSQIVTPDLQPMGDLSLSLQAQSLHIGNPYEAQVELGLTNFAEVAVFRGFKPNEYIFGTEIGLLKKEPFLLSTGFINWSPQSGVDPQPFVEAGYYTEHHKVIVGAIHAGYKNEALFGYAYDFNETWRIQVDFQSGSENSSTLGFTWNITPELPGEPRHLFPELPSRASPRLHRFHLHVSSLGGEAADELRRPKTKSMGSSSRRCLA